MSLNNTINTTGPRIDPMISEAAHGGVDPPPAGNPSMLQSGHDVNTRTSPNTDMGPRSNINLQDSGAGIRKDGLNATANDGSDAIKDMQAMNKMNMEFQVANGLMQMNKGFVEALSKGTKDIGTKTAQLAG